MNQTQKNLKRPTLGLAFSGSGSRIAFYIGFLEEIKKAKIKVDYIAACSSGCIAAASFACGTLPALKRIFFTIKKNEDLNKFMSKGEAGGIYSLEKLEKFGYNVLTRGLKFEEAKPLMGFVAVDLDSGRQIVMSMGDIAHAIRASCTLPGVFEPIQWGGKTLIDGGLLNVIPVDVVKEAGIDIIVGFNLRGTKHIFSETQMVLRKILKLTKRALFIDQLERGWDYLAADAELDLEEIKPGIFSILGKSMDLAIEANKQDHSKFFECDLMVTPEIKKFRFKNLAQTHKELYELGKRTAVENIPKIRKLIESKTKTF